MLSIQPEKTVELTHLSQSGAARMVDVSEKIVSHRMAIAKGEILLNEVAAAAVKSRDSFKGDVLQIARIAGIQAAKQTSSLIPLCHVIPLEKVSIDFEWLATNRLQCTCEVVATAKTGVEMEAITAVSIALATVYDMLKSVDREMTITNVALWQKQGGIRGTYQRDETN